MTTCDISGVSSLVEKRRERERRGEKKRSLMIKLSPDLVCDRGSSHIAMTRHFPVHANTHTGTPQVTSPIMTLSGILTVRRVCVGGCVRVCLCVCVHTKSKAKYGKGSGLRRRGDGQTVSRCTDLQFVHTYTHIVHTHKQTHTRLGRNCCVDLIFQKSLKTIHPRTKC